MLPPLARFGDLRQSHPQPVDRCEVVLFKLCSLAVAALVLFAGQASAQETVFRLKNSMEYPISQLSVSPTQLNMWGPNFLRSVIRPGEAREVSYRAPTDWCMGDLKVSFADGGPPAVWGYLNFCTLQKISLHYDRMTGMTTARYDE
jgi:hypothetical protein